MSRLEKTPNSDFFLKVIRNSKTSNNVKNQWTTVNVTDDAVNLAYIQPL